jgi:hypothetical protein
MSVIEFSENARDQRLMLERAQAYVMVTLWEDDEGEMQISRELDMSQIGFPEISMMYVVLQGINQEILDALSE